MERKTDDIMKIIAIIVGIVILLFVIYYAYNKMTNKNYDQSSTQQMQSDTNNMVNNMGQGVENIGEGIKDTAEIAGDGVLVTIDSIAEMFKDAGNVVRTEVDKIDGMKYKNAQKFKVDNEEFTVYEFENEDDLNHAYSVDEKFKKMIRKGNTLIDTTSEKIMEKINNMK